MERECGPELHPNTQEFGLVTLEATPGTFVASLVTGGPIISAFWVLPSLFALLWTGSLLEVFHFFFFIWLLIQGLPLNGGPIPRQGKTLSSFPRFDLGGTGKAAASPDSPSLGLLLV